VSAEHVLNVLARLKEQRRAKPARCHLAWSLTLIEPPQANVLAL
jgi:hypothetical protein